jgi:hypothetical protein
MKRLSPKYTFCSSKKASSNKGELCNLPQGNYSYAILDPSSSGKIIYYANGTGSFTCDRSAFGGREPYTTHREDCFYTSIPTISYDNKGKPIGFTKCADEFEIYTPPVDTPTDILFGADGKYVYANVTSQTPCSRITFGDPVPYVDKACYCRLSEAPSPSPSPPSPITSSGEGIGEIPPLQEKPSEELPIPSIPHPIITPVIIPDEEAEEQKNANIKKWAIIGSISLVVFILFIIILVIIIRSIKKHKQ